MKFLTLLLITLSTSPVWANIGPAGCGLGNIVFGDQPGLVQVVAATLNGTGMQTFGITSGTSNCTESNRSARLDLYIEGNKVALATEMSQGQGETVKNLSSILGCENQVEVGNILKSNYESIFPKQEVSTPEISKGIIKTLRDNKLRCDILG